MVSRRYRVFARPSSNTIGPRQANRSWGLQIRLNGLPSKSILPGSSLIDGCALSRLHYLRLRPVGLALRALRSLIDGCALSRLHYLRLRPLLAVSRYRAHAPRALALRALRSLIDGCALSRLHSLRSLDKRRVE